MERWSFLTNHARALRCIAHDPGARLRDIAASLGITDRSVHGIVTDLMCPVTLDEDAGVIDGEDVAAEEGPAGGCRAGPLCACWRGDGQSDVTSVMAIRALAWSTMALRSA